MQPSIQKSLLSHTNVKRFVVENRFFKYIWVGLKSDNRANFIKTLFPREFADTDIATIKNFKVDPSKTLIPIDEPENGSLDFHYPEDYAREVNS